MLILSFDSTELLHELVLQVLKLDWFSDLHFSLDALKPISPNKRFRMGGKIFLFDASVPMYGLGCRPCKSMVRRGERGVKPVCAGADQLLRTLSKTGEAVVMAVDSTNLVAEAAIRHKTAPTATAALGRLLTGTLLLGCCR